ncbi:hypothetical protein NEUTE1DRAFT_125959 [Neurospora tetrasperma FGSC 2508]|uniref:Uncharacterized protein n=1 Tax=Neurospora tetrasperma (strain FGSC 2508 / ATCC MYA-4615 / P0657) TaxID=510951 RepID=F8N2K0_NEUT8|nr:uncharacterized protein NEUTE1DRAFT_125959 [Neurospora tetrasperma FGSC 2508]EGO52468.1 hypothetical protein NEUTE1DRAFT_125959 [Neurospora tetrasperma FGSC 2508]
MAGLIPLMLGSSKRTSLAPTQQQQQQPQQHRRHTSERTFRTNTDPTFAFAKQSVPKRQSLPVPARPSASSSTPAPASPALPVTPALPQNRSEWKRAVVEIKKLHIGKRYRACSARCIELLDKIKDKEDVRVEPLYLIYLHFYAATCMEICARPLPTASMFRTTLLQQARTHFEQAASLIGAAENSVLKQAWRSSGTFSSSGSSCHSPTSSISSSIDSRSWTPETRMSSPTSSVFSQEDLANNTTESANPMKRVKKVSFSVPHEEFAFGFSEPMVRPDSPTLGMDIGFFPATVPKVPASQYQEVELPLPINMDSQQFENCEEDDDTLNITKSIDRFRDQLHELREQLERHSANLDYQLEAMATEPPKSPTGVNGVGKEELRALDRQARIERLRRDGWQRKRFDTQRYEELCETVLAELTPA